jgi:predicted DNA-binding protein (MmcQ/YjbR family)
VRIAMRNQWVFRMNIEEFRAFCISKPVVTEGFPFGEDVLTFKVGGKIFALTSLDGSDFKVNLKCDPEYAEKLRARYSEIQPGYHMSKKHWNTVDFQGSLSDALLVELINHSFELVVKSLTKSVQKEIFGK